MEHKARTRKDRHGSSKSYQDTAKWPEQFLEVQGCILIDRSDAFFMEYGYITTFFVITTEIL